MRYTSTGMRNDPMFMRNDVSKRGMWDTPLIRKQTICLDDLDLISSCETKKNDSETNKKKGVHHFVDDYRFRATYSHPDKCIEKYRQYAFVLSPDFSLYADMPLWMQLENTAKNRWVGAYWQSRGITTIPTVSWSTSRSFLFCFDGIEQDSIVAISTVGCHDSMTAFLKGYNAMLEHLNPGTIICYGSPFPHMKGNLIVVEYHSPKGRRN